MSEQATKITDAGVLGGTAAALRVRITAAVAASCGVLVLWVVGFSHLEAVHNAAHDARHSHAFPCH